MTVSEHQQDTDIGATDDIEIRLGANLVHLPIVRAVAANIAMRADFDLDAISDLELAVDEACSTLITHAIPESVLRCRFTINSTALTFLTWVPASDETPPDTSTFGWQVLNTLADSVATWTDASGSDGSPYTVHVEMHKRKPVNEE